MKRVVIEHEIPFFDVDSYRLVWHGNYAKYLEIARCALLQEVGYPYPKMEKLGYFFPIVDMRVKYISSLVFGQKIMIEAWFVDWKNRLRISYEMRDSESGKICTRAQTTQFAISMPDRVTQFEIPEVVVSAIDSWFAESS